MCSQLRLWPCEWWEVQGQILRPLADPQFPYLHNGAKSSCPSGLMRRLSEPFSLQSTSLESKEGWLGRYQPQGPLQSSYTQKANLNNKLCGLEAHPPATPLSLLFRSPGMPFPSHLPRSSPSSQVPVRSCFFQKAFLPHGHQECLPLPTAPHLSRLQVGSFSVH